VQPLLSQAEVVWVPSHAPAGINAALEAMAVSRPVVASRLPELAEVVSDGETGLLFPSGDKAALARQTRVLLDDPDRRRRMGEAGRERVETFFTMEQLVRCYGAVYSGGREANGVEEADLNLRVPWKPAE
jgi:glycosyltransferase involved in cell wall biosynthesis